MKDALSRAVEIVGGTYKLADALKCGQSVVSMWLTRGRVPAERVLAVEAATEGRVTRYELRPDVYGPPPSAGPQTERAAA